MDVSESEGLCNFFRKWYILLLVRNTCMDSHFKNDSKYKVKHMNKNIFDRFHQLLPHFLKVMQVHTNLLYKVSFFSAKKNHFHCAKTYPLITY